MTDQPGDQPGDQYVAMLVDFAATLRTGGVRVGSGDVLTYAEAAATLDATDLMDLYWAGRTTLIGRRDQVPVYHQAFERYFLDGLGEAAAQRFTPEQRVEARSALEVPETEVGGEEREQQETRLGLVASSAQTMRRKDFGGCTPEELAALRRILRTMRLTPPRSRSRRTRPSLSGRSLDVRRTVRETLRLHGEPARLLRRERRLRHRPLTLILDVSGSMVDYSRNLLQFAHTSTRTPSRVEIFAFGTRLTRITRELDRRRPDEALDLAAEAVRDWNGGTQIGTSLDRFVRDHARHGLCRGGIVVICSDGLDRGDPDVLSAAMERLSRLCHRIIWLNPHKGRAKELVPTTLGMMVAAPYVDELLSGHDLASLEEFATTLTRMR
ncbi:MAG TPA: VWA domain-containing protein [Nocardioides sp.]|uniref:vWA domain-containing protein n=1 Tax=Nocardioides sp. TaxID=35761 RepID=UPI002E2FE1B7|nr:VWA domain-containing protein [Nocardioides sp.]HEX3929411.1 VWA domain-containing protein [Nocardioides sp.]